MRFLRMLPALVLSVALGAPACAAGREFVVEYPPSQVEGELVFGVTYTLWIPDDVKTLRGLIVHQHGCGSGACKGGETAAYDLHWQALARKWNCGLLGPSYHQEDKQNCRLWCDPRNGSEATFLRCLDDLAKKSEHPEVARVPWCLWGHSGGAFWASLMQTRHPERIVALWFRSGTAFSAWEKGDIPKPEIPAAAYSIPAMCNPGGKENGDPRFSGAWTGATAMFKAYRAKNALIGFAPDPRTAHECGDSRYLAIPFFDACLAQRLPDSSDASQTLKPMDARRAFLAPLLSESAVPAAEYKSAANEAVWLPDARIAGLWAEYVKTGATSDSTPPSAPVRLRAARAGNGDIELAWDAEADFESGLQGFIIVADGKEIGRLPAAPTGRFGRPLFQKMSYHDTPEKPLPEMRFVIPSASKAVKIEVRAVNSVGLSSEATEASVK